MIAVFGVLLIGFSVWFFLLRDQGETTGTNGTGEFTQTEENNSETATSEPSTPAPLAVDEITGQWDVTFRNLVEVKEEGYDTYEVLGLEETFLEMNVEAVGDNAIYVRLVPTAAYVNGEQYEDEDIAGEEVYADGSLEDDTLSFYLETDAFYLYTTMPILVEVPLAVENGKLSGTYEIVLDELVEDYDMQYTITFELTQR